MKELLWNVAHPMAEGGTPIFLPFGEWDYNGRVRQRLDRAHGEAIANELNARTARGEPGIPVYQGHPDVPEVASRYPDKGALGWVVRIALANQDGREGLELTVEWDRDPGRGFRWFSPYWGCDMRAGGLAEVCDLRSIGLVNNPNIPEFRLANEENLEKQPEGAETEKTNMDKGQVIAALGLPENATDEEVVAAIEKLKAAASDAATKQEAAEAGKAEAEAGREKAEAAFANERAARRGMLLDAAVAEGRIGAAGRAAWEKRLEEDFEAGSAALANEKPLKTQSAVSQTPAAQGAPDLVALANERMKQNPSLTYSAAFCQVRAEHPEVK